MGPGNILTIFFSPLGAPYRSRGLSCERQVFKLNQNGISRRRPPVINSVLQRCSLRTVHPNPEMTFCPRAPGCFIACSTCHKAWRRESDWPCPSVFGEADPSGCRCSEEPGQRSMKWRIRHYCFFSFLAFHKAFRSASVITPFEATSSFLPKLVIS